MTTPRTCATCHWWREENHRKQMCCSKASSYGPTSKTQTAWLDVSEDYAAAWLITKPEHSCSMWLRRKERKP